MSLRDLVKNGVTRRSFLGGTAAAGAAVAVSTLAGCGNPKAKQTTGEPQVVSEEEQVTSVLEEYKSKDLGLEPADTWELPIGTVLFHCEGGYSAAMLTPESASRPNTLGVLSTSSGKITTLIKDPVSGAAFDFFDVRCGRGAFAWVEINYRTRDWHLYAQEFEGGDLKGKPSKLDSGDVDWEPPMFTVTGDSVIWQRMPLATGSKSNADSHCNRWNASDASTREIWKSLGRFATHPRVADGILTIAPRVNNSEGTYYGLTAVDLEDANHTKLDQLILPQSVRPFDAVYTGEQFIFSIEASYDSGGALGQMGTFVGREGGPYVYLGREPAAWNVFNGSRFTVKTQGSHYVVDTQKRVYDIIGPPDRALSYGDYPASEGKSDRFVTYATVRDDKGVPKSVIARVFKL